MTIFEIAEYDKNRYDSGSVAANGRCSQHGTSCNNHPFVFLLTNQGRQSACIDWLKTMVQKAVL